MRPVSPPDTSRRSVRGRRERVVRSVASSRRDGMGTAFEVGADTSGRAQRTVGSALGADSRPRASTTAPYQRLADSDRGTGGLSLADFLGYFSIGLGLAEVLAPNAIAR